ncbi:MAG: hypothetical protein RJA70_2439 [Pseudomonadota bacterium]
MSTATGEHKGFVLRLSQAAALGVVFGILLLVNWVVPSMQLAADTITCVGFLLLAAVLTSELLEIVRLPHLTGYLLVGIVAGPHVLHLVPHKVVVQLEVVNALTLSLIALAGGLELKVQMLRETARSLTWATVFQSSLVPVLMAAVFFGFAGQLPFLGGLSWPGLCAVAALWGVLAASRSPSATLGILSQTKASGPIAKFALGFVMSSDVVVILLLALTITFARPLLSATDGVSLDSLLVLGHEIVGSVTLGTTLGLLLALYLRLVRGHVLLVLLFLGFGMTEAIRYLRFDPLLTFLIAGFVVQNFTKQGPLLMHSVEKTSSVVFVLFFATAGAHLDVPLLGALWPVAVALCAARALFTIGAHWLGARAARDTPVIKKWGWAPLISQAGLTLGLSVVVERTFPSFGAGFRALVIATVAINEVIGPILFKLALDKTGETVHPVK